MNRFKSSCLKKKLQALQKRKPAVLAAELGLEPRQTESESVVLPLHNSAIFGCPSNAPADYYYTRRAEKVKILAKFFGFFGL